MSHFKRLGKIRENNKPCSENADAGHGNTEKDDNRFVSLKALRKRDHSKYFKSERVGIMLVVALFIIGGIAFFVLPPGDLVVTEEPIVVSGNWVYYTNYDDNRYLYRITVDNSDKTKMNSDASRFINADEGFIYYSCFNGDESHDPDDFGIYRIRPDGSERTRLTGDRGLNLKVVDDWIYYIADNSIYRIQVSGSGREQLNSKSHRYIDGFIVADNWIYYNADEGINKMHTDGTEWVRLNEDDSVSINISDGWLYYINRSDEERIYKMCIDGSERTLICENPGNPEWITVDAGWIYFSNRDDKYYPYRIRTDGTEKTRLSKDKTYLNCALNIVNGWIYYINNSEKGLVYMMRPDGSERPLLRSRFVYE